MQALEKILEEIEKAEKDILEIPDGDYLRGNANFAVVAKEIIRSHMKNEPVSNPDKLDNGWIPADQPPKDDSYILLSFSNFDPPVVGRYGQDETGGAYYLGDCDEEDTCVNQDLYVNAWQPLPKPYRPREE